MTIARRHLALLLPLFSIAVLTSSCGGERPDDFVYLSQRNTGTISRTMLLEGGPYTVRLPSARDYPTGPYRTGDRSITCRYQVEIIQTTDAAGNSIFDGQQTRGFRYIVRFRWSPEMSGGLDRADLDGSQTLFSGDGPVVVNLPESARYEIRARSSPTRGRTDIEICSFAVEMRRQRS